MTPKSNDLTGGNRGDTIFVYTDGTDVFHIHETVKKAFDYPSVITYNFWNLRQSVVEQEIIRRWFPNLSKDAYQAIFDANLRGVKVCLISFREGMKTDEHIAISLREMIISVLREKDFKKIKSILKNYNLDDLI